MHETTCIYIEFIQRRLAPLLQMRHYRHGCRGYSWPESLPFCISGLSSESKRVDSQRLRKEQPDIFNQYSKNVSSRRFTIVHAA